MTWSEQATLFYRQLLGLIRVESEEENCLAASQYFGYFYVISGYNNLRWTGFKVLSWTFVVDKSFKIKV